MRFAMKGVSGNADLCLQALKAGMIWFSLREPESRSTGRDRSGRAWCEFSRENWIVNAGKYLLINMPLDLAENRIYSFPVWEPGSTHLRRVI